MNANLVASPFLFGLKTVVSRLSSISCHQNEVVWMRVVC